MDDQPSDQPQPPRPQAPPRRRPPSRAEIRAAQRRAAAPPRRARPAPARSRRPVAVEAPADVDDADEEAGGDLPPPPTDPRQKRMVVLLSVATVVVIGLIGLAFALSSRSDDGDDIPPPASADTPVPVTTFRDRETGLTVEYPRAWRRVQVPLADYRLVVDGGNNVGFTIRIQPIQTPATPQNLQNFKTVTDGLVASNPTVKVLKEQAISLNGMLGYYYFYTFTDGAVEAVHAHYFLFSGNKMNILVFQTFPDDFEGMAATFDKIAESFRSDPNVPSAATAPASTTTTTVR